MRLPVLFSPRLGWQRRHTRPFRSARPERRLRREFSTVAFCRITDTRITCESALKRFGQITAFAARPHEPPFGRRPMRAAEPRDGLGIGLVRFIRWLCGALVGRGQTKVRKDQLIDGVGPRFETSAVGGNWNDVGLSADPSFGNAHLGIEPEDEGISVLRL